MKITGIKSSTHTTETIAYQLSKILSDLGFEFTMFEVNSSRIDLKGPHGKNGPQVKIPNYNITRSTKSGFRKCYQPTWNQYVELNNAINAYLDKHGIVCRVSSTGFTIRTPKEGSVLNWVKPLYVIKNEANGFGPVLTKQEMEERKAA